MSSSCSFRITRTAEDLAQTITELSQRLVKLEQRQQALELRMGTFQQAPSSDELKKLDGVDQLLKDCKELLDVSSHATERKITSIEENKDNFAA